MSIKRSTSNHSFGSSPLFIQNNDGKMFFSDQGGFVMEREEWLEIRTAIDAFYSATSDKEIDDHNKEMYEEMFGEKRFLAPATPTPPKKRPGYIYLIHGTDTPWYKIGQSKKPKIRISQLGTQGPFHHQLIHLHRVEDMGPAEQHWHSLFESKRVNGEWFLLTSEDIEEFIQWTVEE